MSESFEEWGASGRVATQCEVSEKPTHSKILGPGGKPLAYEKPVVGFDLSKRKDTP